MLKANFSRFTTPLTWSIEAAFGPEEDRQNHVGMRPLIHQWSLTHPSHGTSDQGAGGKEKVNLQSASAKRNRKNARGRQRPLQKRICKSRRPRTSARRPCPCFPVRSFPRTNSAEFRMPGEQTIEKSLHQCLAHVAPAISHHPQRNEQCFLRLLFWK